MFVILGFSPLDPLSNPQGQQDLLDGLVGGWKLLT